MSDAIAQGKFRSFGICNYIPAEVQKYLEICEQHGYTKPSIYQGHYNALVRGGEKALFPLLRKYNMAFFAFRSVRRLKPWLLLTRPPVLPQADSSLVTQVTQPDGVTTYVRCYL